MEIVFSAEFGGFQKISWRKGAIFMTCPHCGCSVLHQLRNPGPHCPRRAEALPAVPRAPGPEGPGPQDHPHDLHHRCHSVRGDLPHRRRDQHFQFHCCHPAAAFRRPVPLGVLHGIGPASAAEHRRRFSCKEKRGELLHLLSFYFRPQKGASHT